MKSNKELAEIIRKYEAAQAKTKANGGVLPCPNACAPKALPEIVFDGTATEVIMKALGAIGNKEIFLGVAALLAEDDGSPSDIVQHLVALEVCRKALQKKTGIKWGLAIEQDKVTLTNI